MKNLIAFSNVSFFLNQHRVYNIDIGQFTLNCFRVDGVDSSLNNLIAKIDIGCLLVEVDQADPIVDVVGTFFNRNIEKKIWLSMDELLQLIHPSLDLVFNIVFLYHLELGLDVLTCQSSYHFFLKFDIGTENYSKVFGIINTFNGFLQHFPSPIELT